MVKSWRPKIVASVAIATLSSHFKETQNNPRKEKHQQNGSSEILEGACKERSLSSELPTGN